MPGPDAAAIERTYRESSGRAVGTLIRFFGDIDLEAHREWEERVCAQAGVRAWLPLWRRDETAPYRFLLLRRRRTQPAKVTYYRVFGCETTTMPEAIRVVGEDPAQVVAVRPQLE